MSVNDNAHQRNCPVATGYPAAMDHDRERLQGPVTGAVVAYFDLSRYPVGTVRRAVAIGPELADPGTDERWVPVRRPDRTVDLVPEALIIDVLPVPEEDPWER